MFTLNSFNSLLCLEIIIIKWGEGVKENAKFLSVLNLVLRERNRTESVQTELSLSGDKAYGDHAWSAWRGEGEFAAWMVLRGPETFPRQDLSLPGDTGFFMGWFAHSFICSSHLSVHTFEHPLFTRHPTS